MSECHYPYCHAPQKPGSIWCEVHDPKGRSMTPNEAQVILGVAVVLWSLAMIAKLWSR